MNIPVDLVQRLLGVIGGCISGGYRDLEAFAYALETIAQDARKRHKNGESIR